MDDREQYLFDKGATLPVVLDGFWEALWRLERARREDDEPDCTTGGAGGAMRRRQEVDALLQAWESECEGLSAPEDVVRTESALALRKRFLAPGARREAYILRDRLRAQADLPTTYLLRACLEDNAPFNGARIRETLAYGYVTRDAEPVLPYVPEDERESVVANAARWLAWFRCLAH